MEDKYGMRTHRQSQSVRISTHHGLPWRILGLGILSLLAAGYGLFGNSLSASPGTGSTSISRLVPDHLYGVDFVDGQTGFASGYYGTLLKTENGGSHWTSLNTGVDQLLRRVDAVSDRLVWAVGHRGSVLHSVDGGDSWYEQHHLPNIYLRDLSFADDRIGWVVGHEGSILHTRDGGRSWQRQELSGYSGRDLPRLNAVLALDGQRAVLAGEFGVLAFTEDAGANWHLIDTPGRNTMTALDQVAGLVTAVGLDGIAWQFRFGSDASVQQLSTGTSEHLFDVALNGDGSGVVVGRSVLLGIAHDQLSPLSAGQAIELPYNWFHGVAALANGGLLAVGGRGSIIKANSPEQAFAKIARLGDPASVRIGHPAMGGH